MSDHRALLEIKSVSDSEKERCLVEDILYLEPLDVRVSPNCPSFSSISVLMIRVLIIHLYHHSLESEL